MANRQTTFVPHDMIRADGSRDWQALKALAASRALNEVAKVADMIARGRVKPEYATTFQREIRSCIRHYRGIADALFAAHPANRGKVKMVTITPYGPSSA